MLNNTTFLQIIAISLLSLILIPKIDAQKVNTTTVKEVPYLSQVWSGKYFLCSSVLISNKHVLTSTTCVYDYEPSELSVTAATSRVNVKSGVLSKVDKIFMPMDYNNETYNRDVAVLKLKTPLKGSYIRPIKLCSQELIIGVTAKVSGWFVQRNANKMRTVNITIKRREECSRLSGYNSTDIYTLFCASAPENSNCVTEGEGALVIGGEFCGFVAWDIGCKKENTNGIYVNLYSMREFTNAAMKQ